MTEVKPNTGAVAGNPNPAASPAATPSVPPQTASTSVNPTPAGEVKTGVPSSQDVKSGEPTLVPLGALQEEREKRQQLQSELEDLRKIVNTVAPQVNNQQTAPVGDVRQEVEKLWESDPKKAVQAEIMMAVSWYDSINNAVEDQMDKVATKDPTFVNYRGQVRSYIKTLPLEQRARNGVVDLALAVVKGQNIDAIIEQQKAELYRKFQAGELAGMINPPAAGTFTQAPQQTGVQLNPEQIAVARAMGMSEQDYVKYMIPGR